MTEKATTVGRIEFGPARSTREIVADALNLSAIVGVAWRGERALGHNPSWVKAADFDALKAQVDARDTALRALVQQWREQVVYLRQRADARYAEQTTAGIVASDALVAAVRATEQCADALATILGDTK